MDAWDPLLKKPVTIRTLLPPSVDEPRQRERYLEAARRTAQFSHPNILDIYDFGAKAGQMYWVTESTANGETLATRLAREEIAPETLLPIVKALCYAHARGVVHGMLAPENVWMMPDGQVKVAGFGTAVLEASWGEPRLESVHYFSPEQARGEIMDARTDIYALAVLLYRISSGRTPLEAENIFELIQKQLTETPAPLDNPHLREAVANSLLTDRSLRNLTAENFLDLLTTAG